MKILLVNNESFYFNILEDLLKGLTNVKAVHYKKASTMINRKFDGIILSGGKKQTKEYLKYTDKLLEKAIEKNIPILGICAGQEIISAKYGIKRKRVKKITGFFKIKKLSENLLFRNLPNETIFYVWTCDIIPKLPTNFELVATSNKIKIQSLKMKNKPVYTIQFHPEMSGYYGEIILKNFLKICKR